MRGEVSEQDLRSADELGLRQPKMRALARAWASIGAANAVRRAKPKVLWAVNRYLWQNKFDKYYGVETFTQIPLVNLTIMSKEFDKVRDNRKYQSTPVATLKQMMRFLPRDLSDYVFVDIGSGKGKALLVASDYNFKSIVGVEFASELHNIACDNIKRYRSEKQRCHDIRSVLDDAAYFPIPGEKCVFYLYNPFRGSADVMARVLSNISHSFIANPRKMYFLYLNPQNLHLFDSMNYVRPIAKRRFALRKGVIYETVL